MSPIVRTRRQRRQLLGGSIDLPANACRHEPARPVRPWVGEPGTAGTVAVVGAGKMGLPLAAQFASHGWSVIAVDIDPAVVAAINDGRSHIGEEPGLAELVADAHAAGRLRATLDGAEAAREADVVVLIVPVMLDASIASRSPHRWMPPSTRSHPGSTPARRSSSRPRCRSATRAAGTRRAWPRRPGLTLEDDLFVAFSPERLYSGAALRNLATYPKLVGGLGAASTARAAAFYDSVLDADVVAMSSAEAAEFAKLADTTYRDVNIALANEFARYADRIGVDLTEVIAAAEQPAVQPHPPAGARRRRALHPGLPALPARPRAGARARRARPRGQRRPGRRRASMRCSRGARRRSTAGRSSSSG